MLATSCSETTFRRYPPTAVRADLPGMKLHRQYGTALLLHHLLRVVDRREARPSPATPEAVTPASATGTPERPAA